MSQSPIDMLSIRESWRMFRILAEIVDGFETLSDLGPCVSIFGSARVKPENPLYAEGETIAKLLVESGYGVITGGGPGLMEAGTIDELSEAFVLAQTKRIRPLPIILYQSTFWNGFLDWVRSTMVSGGYIRASEVDDLITVCDTPEQVVQQIRRRVIL